MAHPITRSDLAPRAAGASRPEARLGAVAARWALPAVVLVLAGAYFLDPNPRLDFSVFDTRDAESYLALSQSIVDGRGYTRSLDPSIYIPHTTWPPGLPLLLAPFTALAGTPVDFLTVKLGMIAYGALGIVLAYLYAKRLSQAPMVRLAVPLLLAFNPYYWQFSRMTDSEMPTVLWALVALLLAEIGWTEGQIRHSKALLFGLVGGFGMLIRGSFWGALFLPFVYVAMRRDEPAPVRRMGSRLLAYAGGFLAPFLAWHIRNSFIDTKGLGVDGIDQLEMILRSVPVDPHSPLRTMPQIFADIGGTIAHSVIYQLPKSLIPGLWNEAAWRALGAAGAPAAVAISLAVIALSCRARRNLPVILMYGSMAALNIFYAAGGMTRLWVPVTCLIAISLPVGAEALFRNRTRRAGAGALVAVTSAALAASLAFYIANHDRNPYHDADYAALADLFRTVRAHEHLDGNVLTPNPQAFGLYTGLKAPIAVPGIGINPRYDYVILPTVEWNEKRLPATLVLSNSVWSLIALETPLDIAEFRARYQCTHATIPAMSVLTYCLIS